jgi:DNA-3-methyladenine glycosylase II
MDGPTASPRRTSSARTAGSAERGWLRQLGHERDCGQKLTSIGARICAVSRFAIVPEGPFSLDEAANFGFGPQMARPKPSGGTMALAFTLDGYEQQAGVFVRQTGDRLDCELFGDGDPGIARVQVERVLSVDHSGTAWSGVGARDPLIAALQADFPGLRPVLFYSPYEAAAWSVISQRRNRVQAAGMRKRLSAEYGVAFQLPDGPLEAFPTPEALLTVTALPGMEPQRIVRLHGVAEAALDGRLDAAKLAAMAPEDALRQLQKIRGIGPMYAGLVLLRATGVTDVTTLKEPRLAGYIEHFYALDHPPAPAELERIAEPWRPFRTWASVLIRVAGDRLGVPVSGSGV